MSAARLQSVLADLQDRYSITAGDLTAEELTDLVNACNRADSPFTDVNASLIEKPVLVTKGVAFYPLTAGATIWLEEYASQWWKRTSMMYAWARLYALSHARDKDAFISLDTKEKARKAILKTALRLVCYEGEVSAAVAHCYGNDPDEEPRENKRVRELAETDFASLVARLEVSSGIAADEWLWGRSLNYMLRSYCELSTLNASMMGGHIDRHNELDDAVENLARVMARISRRIKEGKKKDE